MVEGIPGSSPDWRGANMKTKGRATPSEVPLSHLNGGTAVLAIWSGSSLDTMQHNSRRHFHQFQVAQTTAWDCLPCVDVAHQSTAQATAGNGSSTSINNSSSSSGRTVDLASSTLALSNQAPRRHRHQVPPPPCQDRHQGKRMLHAAAPPSTCKELLQDPHLSTAPAATTAPSKPSLIATSITAAAARVPGTCASSDGQYCGHAPRTAPLHVEVPAAKPAGGVFSSSRSLAPAAACQLSAAGRVQGAHECSQLGKNSSRDYSGSLDCAGSSRQASSRSSNGSPAGGLQPAEHPSSSAALATCLQAGVTTIGCAAAKSPGKKAGRVEDDPNFFRTPKDAPTLQRFAASLAQLSVSQGGAGSTAQRHEAGIRAKQQAQLAAAAREVAALDAGSQQDVD